MWSHSIDSLTQKGRMANLLSAKIGKGRRRPGKLKCYSAPRKALRFLWSLCSEDPYHPSNTPIYQTSTFVQPSSSEFGPYDYTRQKLSQTTPDPRIAMDCYVSSCSLCWSTVVIAMTACFFMSCCHAVIVLRFWQSDTHSFGKTCGNERTLGISRQSRHLSTSLNFVWCYFRSCGMLRQSRYIIDSLMVGRCVSCVISDLRKWWKCLAIYNILQQRRLQREQPQQLAEAAAACWRLEHAAAAFAFSSGMVWNWATELLSHRQPVPVPVSISPRFFRKYQRSCCRLILLL